MCLFLHFGLCDNYGHGDHFTDVGVEDLLHHQLKELFGHASFVDTLLPLKLYIELLLQVSRVLHGDHLQLPDRT